LQLWGEAATYESRGESTVLDESLWDAAAIEQEKRRVIDPWEDALARIPEYIDDYQSFTTGDTVRARIIHREPDRLGSVMEKVESNDLLVQVLRVPPGILDTRHFMKLATVMKRLGWDRADNGKVSITGRGQVRGYFRYVAEKVG